jgi:hypothetical protein
MLETRKYKSLKDRDKDIMKMESQGWKVKDMHIDQGKRAGCLAWLIFGIFNLLRKRKTIYIVTFYK